MNRRFLKQVAPLLLSLAIVGGLSLMVRYFEEKAPRPFDRLLVEVLPEIPILDGWPVAFLERLEAAHAGLEDRALQRSSLVELAYLYHANGFLQQAQACYLGLESFETVNPRWPYLLGVVTSDRVDKASVATHFARAIELDPTQSLAYLRLGHAYREGGLLEEAKTAYEYRLLGAPNDAWAMAYLGLVASQQKRWQEARDWLEKARAAEPSLSLVYEILPEVYQELGDFEAAKAARKAGGGLDLVVALEDPALSFMADYCYIADRLLEFAEAARRDGDLDRALVLLQRAMEQDLHRSDVLEELSKLVREMEE